MKNKITLFISFFIISSSSLYTQSDIVGDRLQKLFVLCFTDNYKTAAKYIVYRGDDTSRNWKDVYNFYNEQEKKAVIDVCTRIKGYLETGGDYELTDYTEKEESEGTWYTWLVEFQKGDKKKVYFSFLKIGKRYALGDID
jgi:hypothetical protein